MSGLDRTSVRQEDKTPQQQGKPTPPPIDRIPRVTIRHAASDVTPGSSSQLKDKPTPPPIETIPRTGIRHNALDIAAGSSLKPKNAPTPPPIDRIPRVSMQQRTAPNTTLAPLTGVSWAEFVFQVFISIEGPAIFIIPAVFKDVGYLLGICGSLFIAFLYTYTMQVLLWCDDEVSSKKMTKQQSLYGLVTSVFENYSPRMGSWLNFYLKYEIILSYTMNLSFGLFFTNKTVQLILAYFDIRTSDQFVLLCLAIPVMLICWFPHIRALTRLSYFITSTLIVVLLEVVYYLIIHQTTEPRVVIINNLSSLPDFLFTVFFVITYTPMIYPLKSEMKYPSNLTKPFGGLNLSIFLIVILNTFISLLAYFQLGDDVCDNIIANLPQTEIVMITNCLFVLSLLGGGALLFFVLFQTLWMGTWENYFKKFEHPRFYEYLIRSMLGFFIVTLAMVIPTFSLFINLISCFSYPYDSVVLPLVLESVLVWQDRPNGMKAALILTKNIVLCVLCVLACVAAFYASLIEILSYYRV